MIQEDEPNELNMKPGTFKGRKPEKQMNFQNIFTQTFGSFDRKIYLCYRYFYYEFLNLVEK